MTSKDQQETIAEVCGWLPDHIRRGAMYYVPRIDAHVGDPLSDLNAIHEAKQTLAPDQQSEYARELCRIHFPLSADKQTPALSWAVISIIENSTAAQCAEAFLRAKNLWKE